MKFFHPIFMVVLLGMLFKVRALGRMALAINSKSPEADQKDVLIAKHARFGIIATVLFVLGFVGGIFSSVKFLQVSQSFMQTYGHGFIGVIIISLLITEIFIGKSIKNIKAPKIRKRFFTFHLGIFTFLMIVGVLSLITGSVVLILGPSALT